jgi:hypothetical protein
MTNSAVMMHDISKNEETDNIFKESIAISTATWTMAAEYHVITLAVIE